MLTTDIQLHFKRAKHGERIKKKLKLEIKIDTRSLIVNHKLNQSFIFLKFLALSITFN